MIIDCKSDDELIDNAIGFSCSGMNSLSIEIILMNSWFLNRKGIGAYGTLQ